jgi:hypothetical protein
MELPVNTRSFPYDAIDADDLLDCLEVFDIDLDYPDKEESAVGRPDPLIAGSPELDPVS